MLEQLEQRAAQAIELARSAGADDAWARATRSRSVDFQFRDGELEKVEESTSRGLSLDLYADGRYSSHRTTDLRPEPLRSFVAEAVALTKALQPDPFRKIPDPQLFQGRPTADLDLVDSDLADLSREQRLDWLEAIDARARADERVISATGYVSDGHTLGAAASSNGFSGTWERTALWLGAEATVRDEGDKRPEGWVSVGARHQAQVRPAEEVAAIALGDALRRLGAVKGPTRRTTMVVDPRAGRRLVGQLLGPATGRSVQQDRSFWAGNLGEKQLSEALTIVDRPLVPRGFGSRHFDGEGISASPLPLVEAGVLSNLYLDTYYARKLEVSPTTGSASNQVVQPGQRDLAAILADVGEAIYVTSWLGGNADPTTGDFSLGMRGHVVKGGEVGEPVGEMNVTGNLVELFAHLVEVGNDPWPYSRTLVPTLVFADVQFSGA